MNFKFFFLVTLFLLSFSSKADEINPTDSINFCQLFPDKSINKSFKVPKLKITLDKEKKFYRNLMAAKVHGERFIDLINNAPLDAQFKKWFNGKLSFQGQDDRVCEFKIKLRLTGDYLDHLSINTNDGFSFSALIKPRNKSIESLSEFKLFIPKSRNNEIEIFGNTMANMLGILSPETFSTSVEILNRSHRYLIQENITHNFLEANMINDSPLLEGDERLKMLGFEEDKAGSENTLQSVKIENIGLPYDIRYSLGRIKNSKWSIANNSNLKISIDALNQLNQAYIEFLERTKQIQSVSKNRLDFRILSSNEKENILVWQEYEAFIDTLSKGHALIPTNQQFYYDPSSKSLFPILYDANFYFPRKWTEVTVPETIRNDSIIGAKSLLIKVNEINPLLLWSNIKDRNASYSQEEVEVALENIMHNLNVLLNRNINRTEQAKIVDNLVFFGNYPNEYNSNKRLVYSIGVDMFLVCLPLKIDCQPINLKENEIEDLISGRLKVEDNYLIYIDSWD